MEPPQDKADADLDLSKVISFEKRQELYNVLHSEDQDHYSRLWFVGFMKFCGYTADEICNIIHDEAAWSDYDARMIFLQVQSIFRTGDRRSTSAGICTGRNCSIQIEEKKCQPLVKCNSANPCPDSVGEYCYIPFGEYHLPSADEKIRRAILCLIEHQVAKLQRQKARINALRALLLSILFRRV